MKKALKFKNFENQHIFRIVQANKLKSRKLTNSTLNLQNWIITVNSRKSAMFTKKHYLKSNAPRGGVIRRTLNTICSSVT
jgi:hypothetical protein